MTNGTASQSRMSNGSVSSTNGSTLVVSYAGGLITIPALSPGSQLHAGEQQDTADAEPDTDPKMPRFSKASRSTMVCGSVPDSSEMICEALPFKL